jgi:hypothetical protein
MEYQKMVRIPIVQYTYWKNNVNVKSNTVETTPETPSNVLEDSSESQSVMKSKSKPYSKNISTKSRNSRLKSNNNINNNNRKHTTSILKVPNKKEKNLNKHKPSKPPGSRRSSSTISGGAVKVPVFPVGVLKGEWIKL